MEYSYLNEDNAADFFRLHYPDAAADFIEKRRADLIDRIKSGKRSFQDYILIYQSSKPCWSFVTFQDGELFGIQTPNVKTQGPIRPLDWEKPLKLLNSRLLQLSAHKASIRFIESDITEGLVEALGHAGFSKHNERIEYRTELSKLPDDLGSPILWKAVCENSLTLEFAAEMMGKCSELDPNWELTNNPLELLKADLEDDELYCKHDAIHIGFLNNQPMAFMFAQSSAKTGWGRLTYMGLTPEFRGQGLGKWLHRHGFTMLKNQGAKIYHGGTITENSSMIRTFESHGCQFFNRVQEWNFSLTKPEDK